MNPSLRVIGSLLFVGLILSLAGGILASHVWAKERAEWDQDKAVAMVEEVLTIEERGDRPWEGISWETGIQQAETRAREEGKPIFVYLYLRKNVGPADAPC